VEAHGAMLEFLAARAGYARKGHHGAARRVGGRHDWTSAPVSAARLARARPQLHVHGTTLNKVVCPDGKVRALDYSLILQVRDAAGAYATATSKPSRGKRLAERAASAVWRPPPTGGRGRSPASTSTRRILFSKRTAAITPAWRG